MVNRPAQTDYSSVNNRLREDRIEMEKNTTEWLEWCHRRFALYSYPGCPAFYVFLITVEPGDEVVLGPHLAQCYHSNNTTLAM